MKQFSVAEMERAKGALASAKLVVRVDPNSAASRAYYAMFHALVSLLALRGQQFRKHRDVRAALHRELVHTGEIAVERGQDYNEVMDLRELGDYGGVSGVSTDDAARAVAKAERFVEAMRELLVAD
jgi:hypothetical protein